MGKFKLNAIRGIDNAPEVSGDKNKINLGNGLLNAASQAVYKDGMWIEYIPRDQIDVNENNFYSIGNVSSLKASIETVGLKQPLIVHPKEDGRYKLIGGERRITAIDGLIEEGKWTEKIPCVIQEYDRVRLPLSEDEKELFCIITTNREQRDYTDADLMHEVESLKKIYANLRKAGVDDMIVGVGENGEEIHRKIKGVKTRALIAEDLGVSTGWISQVEKIKNNGSEHLLRSLDEGKISIKRAAEIASLSIDEQDKLIEQIKEERKQKPGNGSRPSGETQYHVICEGELEEDINFVSGLLDHLGTRQMIRLEEDAYKKYRNAMTVIKKIMMKQG